ncbi:helix-turn-helix domain-containing protein [Schinkia sp. CFF1]
MSINNRLKELRNKSNISQQELANRLNINRSTYARYETGDTQPDIETIKKIARFFDVSTDYLLGTSDHPTQPDGKNQDFNPIEEINKIIKNLGLKEGASGFFDIEKWKSFGPEDVEEIRKHFEWVAHKAKERKYNPDDNDTDGLE